MIYLVHPQLHADIYAFPVRERSQKIEWAYFADTFESIDAALLVTDLSGEFHALRARVDRATVSARHAEGPGRLLCGQCSTPVRITGHRDGSWRWFYHVGNSPRCPWYSGKFVAPDLLAARVHRGRQEGARHTRLKLAIADALARDPRNSETKIDCVRMGRILLGERRKPDVAFIRDGQEWVIELQVSWLPGTEAAGRDRYYEREGVRLLWLFPGREQGQFTQEDEAAKNVWNVFTFGDPEIAASRERGELVLLCHYTSPALRGGAIVDEPATAQISLADLKTNNLRPFYFDYEAACARLRSPSEERARKAATEYVRAALRHFESDFANTTRDAFVDARDNLAEAGFPEVREYFFEGQMRRLLSIREGRPVGYKVATVYQVIDASLLQPSATQQRPLIHVFAAALLAWRPPIETRHWARIKEACRRPTALDRRFDRLTSFLFPELAPYLAAEQRADLELAATP